MFEQDSLERDAATAFAVAGGLPVAAYLKKKYTDNLSDSFAKYGRALPGSEYLDDQINLNGSAKLSSSANSFQKSILSALMAIEEMSPLHILRTLQLSNLIQPFTELTSNNELIHFSGRQIRGQEAFYRALLNQAEHDKNVKIKRALQLQDLSRGMFYLNGDIYGATKSGTIDMNDKVLSNAKLVLGSLTNGDIQSSNHIVEKLGDIIGGKVDKSFAASSPLMFVGGPSESVFAKQWGKSALRYSMEVGFKTLDNPVAGIEEMLHGVGAGHLGLFKSKPWQKLREISSHVQLGTNGIYDLGIRESLKISAKNIAIKSSAAYIGYEVLDSALRSISPQGGIFENGIATGMANLYASARVNFAKVWSDRFQGYKEKQEQAAPGSTNLTTLMAFPLGGALAGAQLGYFGRVGLASAKGIEKSAEVFNVESQSKLLSRVGLTEKFKPMKRNALVGGLIGGALTLPFLPGALIGESSEELKALYSGKKDVLDRKNKYWTFGGGAWEGQAPDRFKKHWVAQANADAVDKVRYGDDETKKKMNPFLRPFSYLKDPYQFEKRNAESMPYPVWGMDVSYGGIFGKAFEKTIGKVIKPDIINPALYDAIEETQSKTTIYNKSLNFLAARREFGSTVENSVKDGIKELGNETVTLPNNVHARDRGLMIDGLMKVPQKPGYSPNLEAGMLTYQSFVDFAGIKGWTSSLAVGSLGLTPDVSNQLARSGEASSAARDLQDMNLGDLMGLGEFQRKILPTSAGAQPERLNPIRNNSPSWLPNDPSKFYLDFSRGNPYSKIAMGEERLAGVGFAALNPEVSGVDPDDYSLVYKHKILADVARGSGEHQEHRAQAIEAYKRGNLSKREIEILGETLHREEVLQQKKEFYEGPSRIGHNPVNIPQSVLWEKMRSNAESPLEMLTPLRPVAKFLHQRTAIEDYIETQLGGSDAAIWTNPYSHFIKPTANKIRQTFELSGNFIPQETREKYNIDEYFDKLDYLRKRKQGSDSYSLTTVIGSSMSGLNTKEKVLKFRGSLSDDQKDYFHSFSNETDQKKRNMIRALLPDDVRRGYEQIWSNLDTAKEAKKSGSSVQNALLHKMDEQTKRLRSVYDVSLEREDKQKARELVHRNKDNYVGVGMGRSARVKATENEILRAKMADIEALSYVEKRTGVPSKNFAGWDPRIKTDDIKIKTLSIGGEDLRRFGFWQKDEERMRSLEALSKESDQVFTQIESIKANIRSDRALKMGIERTMFEKGGFKASNIQFVDRDFGGILVKDNSN